VDTGTVTLTVAGVVAAQTSYGDGATPSSIAEGLAAGVTSNSLVSITAVDDTLNLQAKQAGSGTNYSYTLQTTSWDSASFSQPSFAYPAITGTLGGGADASSSSSGSQKTIYSYSISNYDAVGNIVGYTDSVMGIWSMSGSYDQLNRLTSTSATAGSYSGLQMSWSYDAFGNRTSESLSGTAQMPVPTSSSTAYNASNRISSTSLGSVGYDAAGNVTQDNQNQYLYDGDGRVCAVKNLLFGTMTGYVYGADGTRVSTGTITTWGSCDPTINGYQAQKDSISGPAGGQLTETGLDSNGNVVWAHTNVWGSDGLIATYDPNGLHFYLNDWNGSRRVQTDYEGVVEQTCTNLPYGDGESCSAAPTEDLYAGLERDSESGLDHAMFRQYSSTFGRWTTPDPYGGSYDWGNPQSLNRYAYVGGSPLGAVDPSGLDGSCSWDPYGVYGCLTLTNKIASSIGLDSTDFNLPLANLIGDIPFLGPLINDTPVGILTGAGELFDDLGQSFGWWGGGSSFHGNVAASQSGKNVPSASNGFGMTLRNPPGLYDQFYNQLPDWAQSTLNFGQAMVDFGTGNFDYNNWWHDVKSCVGDVGIPAILDDANPFGTGASDAAGYLAPGAADAASRYFYNKAITHAMSRGLTTPLRSSIYRGLMGKSATASAVGDAVPLAIVDKALFAGVRAEAAGCQ
jgi:RHS repeat-associated protein